MLWRQGYSTATFRDASFPIALEGPVVIGVFDVEGLKDLVIWHRMIGAELSLRPQVAFSCAGDRVALLREALPPSIGEDALGCGELVWPELRDLRARAFAAVVVKGRCSVLMAGPPTEEAWDEFAKAYRVSR